MAWYNNAKDLGGAVSDAWKDTGIVQGKTYDPYNPDAANFQNPNSQGNIDRYQQGSQDAQNAQGPGVNPYWQGQNQNLAQALWQQSQGQGPSLAQNQFQQSLGQALSAQTAAAASGATSSNPALAQRGLAHQLAGMNQAAVGQAGALRLQEQMGARAMLSDVLSRGQQGDIAAGNLDLQHQQQQNQMVQFFESLGYSQAEADRAAMIEMERIKAGAYGQAQANQFGQNQGNQQMGAALLGGVVGAGQSAAQAFAMSDERQKKDVRDGSGAARGFLESLGAALLYRYKDPSVPGAAEGDQMGVMAQDVAKTPMGAQMVQPTPSGLALDPARSLGAVLAGQADLHNRVKSIESGARPLSTVRDPQGRDIHSMAPLAESMEGYDPSLPTMPLNSTVGPRLSAPPAGSGEMRIEPKKRGKSILDMLLQTGGAGGSGGSATAAGPV